MSNNIPQIMINQNEQFLNSRVTKNHSAKSVIKAIKYLCIDTNQEGFVKESWNKSQFNLSFLMAVVNECFDKKY